MKRICLMTALAACTTLLAADKPLPTNGLTIDDYLGGQGLTWSTGGDAAWFGQTAVSRTGTAMQSGDISDDQESWIETTVQGPCDLKFWWTVSSEEAFDFLIFSVNGELQDSLSGYNAANPAQAVGWTQKTLSFPAGSHTLRWTYVKDSSESLASDCGWLANVEYIPYVTVTFDAQGGTASTNEKVVQGLAPYGTLPTATKTGYGFAGWETADGQPIEPEIVVTILTNHTLYAQWAPNSYTLTLDAQGGEVLPSITSVTYGAAYGDLPVPTRNGHLFDGWFTQPVGGGTEITAETIVAITDDQTLYATWVPILYSVTFDAQGGEVLPSVTSVMYGAAYGDLPAPTRNGYLFDGWFTQPAGGGTEITAETTVTITDDQTLYATWAPNTYNVLFDGQGGEVNPANKMVSYQASYGALPASVLADAVMESWWTQPNGKGQQITAETNVLITADQTLYAKWDINSILGTSGLTWTTDGSDGAFWLPQADVKPAGRTLAMQAGAITHNQGTWIETTVTGPGTFSFSWAIAAEVNRDMITCTTNGVVFKTLTAKSVNWVTETVTVGEGVCTLRWTFAKDGAGNVAADTAWLAAMSWTPQAGGFSEWASNHGLVGDLDVLFAQDRNADGIPNGFEYAFGANLPAEEMMLMVRSVNGRMVADIPKQDPATIPFVTVTLKASSDLTNWTLPTVSAGDTTGMPGNRDWREAQGSPAQAFFKLHAELK